MKTSTQLLKRNLFLAGLISLLTDPSGMLFAQNQVQADPIAIYRKATDALKNQDYLLASELFNQVVSIRPGTPLAIDAGYFELAARSKHPAFASPELQLELARASEVWRCEALAWAVSESSNPFQDFAQKLTGKLRAVLDLEIQVAYSTQQWKRALSLIEEFENLGIPQGEVSSVPGEIEAGLLRLRLMKLECYVHLQKWMDAEELAEMLQITAEEKLAQSIPPPWVESLMLRQAEIAMVLGKWNVAESTVWKIRTHFPECKESSQVDYVLARCLVHETKFEEARQLLASILVSQPEPTATMRIKAWWIIAETHLMQRNIPDAKAAYEQVAELGAGSSWATLAQRQLAICLQASEGIATTDDDPNNAAPLRSTQKQTPKRSR